VEQPKQRDLFPAPFDLSKPFMSKSEAIRFRDMRELGALSFYDTGACEVCGAEVPKIKRYCSQTCASKKTKEV